MTLSQFLIVLASALALAAIAGGANWYGRVLAAEPPKVERTLEVKPDYTADWLKDWVSKNPDAALKYVSPLLFPLDLIFLLFMGAALAMASYKFAAAQSVLASALPLFLVLPLLYIAADLTEGLFLARMLRSPEAITPSLVTVVQSITKIKIWSFVASIGQTLFLCLGALWKVLRPG